MPRPVPVYVVERPTIGGQIVMFMLIVGLAAFVLKLAIIFAVLLGAAWLALRVFAWQPRLFSFLLAWGVPTYLFASMPVLAIGWAILFPIAVGWLIHVNTDKPVAPKALPAPEA